MNENETLNPKNDQYFDRTCPHCKCEVPYFNLPWNTVNSAFDGKPVARRMGKCPACNHWVKAVLVWPDEGDGNRGWAIEPVHPLEVAQLQSD